MKKIYALASVLLFSLLTANSQQSVFSKVLWDAPQNGVQAYAVVNAFDSGYIMVGDYSNQSRGLILKTDLAGNILWNKTFSMSGNHRFTCIITTNDSNYFVAGTLSNGAFCAKINELGDTLWTRPFQFGTSPSEVYSIEQTADSGYVMTGFISYSTNPYSKVFVIKLSKNGALQWSTILASGNWANTAKSIKQTADGGYIITGQIENGPSTFTLDAVLIKLNSSGTVMWAKKYNISPTVYFYGNDVVVTNTGYVLHLSYNNNVALLKTDLSGNVVWGRMYNGISSNANNYPTTHIRKTNKGTYVFLNDGSTVFGGATLMNVDTLGTQLWTRDIFFNGTDVIQAKDSGFFALGNGPVYGVSQLPPTSPQIGIVKTDTVGYASLCVTSGSLSGTVLNFTASAITYTASGTVTIAQFMPTLIPLTFQTFNGCVNFLGGTNNSTIESDIIISPNPSSGIFTVDVGGQTTDDGRIEIINILGEIVFTSVGSTWLTTGASRQASVNLSSQSKGIYFVKVQCGDKVSTQKIIFY